jgi:hypothetical protein
MTEPTETMPEPSPAFVTPLPAYPTLQFEPNYGFPVDNNWGGPTAPPGFDLDFPVLQFGSSQNGWGTRLNIFQNPWSEGTFPPEAAFTATTFGLDLPSDTVQTDNGQFYPYCAWKYLTYMCIA